MVMVMNFFSSIYQLKYNSNSFDRPRAYGSYVQTAVVGSGFNSEDNVEN